VPVLVAQALTLRFELGSGIALQDVADQDAASSIVEDVDGFPMAYLTVLGPDAHGDFWEAIHSASLSEEPHFLVSTGGSDLYSTTQFADATKDSITDLWNTLIALGGRDNLRRIVSFGVPGQIYLQDTQNRYWNVDKAAIVPDSEVAELTDAFHGNIERVATNSDYIENIRLLWRCLLGEASQDECNQPASGAAAAEAALAEQELLDSMGYGAAALNLREPVDPAEPGFGLNDMRGANGELDFGKAQKILLAGGVANFSDDPSAAPQDISSRPIGWFGWGSEYTLKALRHSTGIVNYSFIGRNWQYTWELNFSSREPDADFDNFTLFDMNPGAVGQVGGRPVGCGPGAFLRLATWYNFERSQYVNKPNVEWYGDTPSVPWGRSFEERMHPRTEWMAQRMLKLNRYTTQPDGAGNYKVYYRPLLAEYMLTHAFLGSGLTTAGAFLAGANRWLGSVGSSMRLRGGGYYIVSNFVPAVGWAYWNNEVWKMYSALAHSIGTRNEPAIALYLVPGSAHYSPIMEARLINWHINAEVFITAPPLWTGDAKGASGKEISISGFFNLVGGAYELR